MKETEITLCNLSEEELKKINSFSKKELRADEVYAFNLTLCDNEVDRDNECFSDAALGQMAKLFKGITAIKDHAMKSENQVARTFDTYVEQSAQTNSRGIPYKALKAKAYMPVTSENKGLIAEIEAGIKKEVSISCSVGKRICSVCGREINGVGCKHIAGKEYDGKRCFTILDDVRDVYEWSFVAVPAQKKAGVTKAYNILNTGVKKMNEIKKALSDASDGVKLNGESAVKLLKYIDELETKAASYNIFKDELGRETAKLFSLIFPDVERGAVLKFVNKFSAEELKELKSAFENKVNEIMPLTVQLETEKSEKLFNGEEFNI